tara:strand:- start:1041 stop:1469 length:429 start_codon:yes stop_codon:yes gene_type:complete
MKKIILITKIIFIYFLFTQNSFSSSKDYFNVGKDLFDKKEYEKSKILFERDIIFNPKSTRSYLYLSKIFNIKDNEEEENINLNNALLLDPVNDEAIYLLTLLKIKRSDYDSAKELIEKFDLVCDSFCSKSTEMRSKLDKITP